MQVKSKKLGVAPALVMALAWKALVELHEKGFGECVGIPVHWSFEATWAESLDGTPMGLVVWNADESDGTAFVTLGYVKPECRQQGVYRALNEAVEADARKRGFVRIMGGTHANNITMRAAAKALGRIEYGVRMVKML